MRLGRAIGTAALATAVLLTSACSGSPQAEEPGPGDPGTTPASSGQTAAPALDPAHAVDPPGRRTGAWGPADIVVNGSETIPEDALQEVRALEGVNGVEQISLATVPIENRALRVAAVDVDSYRNWVTDLTHAEATEVWARVADGEVALRPSLEKRAPLDAQDFLTLGSAQGAPAIHVGAYAQQSWLVDAVVNETWIADLEGMTEGNALLIRTGGKAPDTLRKPIERILRGTDASVQMTDVVAREGLDPGAVQTAVVVGTVADAVGVYRYTVLEGGRIAPDPAWVRTHISTEAVPILGTITCNKLMFPQLRAALEEVVSRGLASEIDPGQYAGCYYPRFIAGSTTLSNHAFGLALDLNVAGNQRGTVGEIDRDVVAIFKSWGFAWGGDWAWTDPMHFEMNELVQPR
ncbi:M15 family metallopeptidase [Nocardioides pyridinolyticus]